MDKQLLQTLQADADAGLQAALAAYGGLVKAIVRRVLRESAQDAEECMADVFVALWKNAAALQKSGAPVKAWLAVTARNTAISRLRRLASTRGVLALDEALCTAEEAWLYEKPDVQNAVQEQVAQMPPPDKEIFIRKYYYLQPAAEIAAALGLSADVVYARLSRGRQKLRAALLKGGYAV